MKIVATIIFLGLAVGIVGGLFIGDHWFHGGEIVIIGGFLGLFAYASWKRPDAMLNTMIGDGEDEPEPPLAESFAMDQELRRKDRGEERREK